MKKSLILIITLIASFFFLLTPSALALKQVTVSQVTKLIDFRSVPNSYAFYNADYGDGLYQVHFINPKSQQRVSFTFSRFMRATNEHELKKMVEVIIKTAASKRSGDIQSKITSLKKFTAHDQVNYYYNVEELKNNQLCTKAVMGFLGNYKGKSIILQSFGLPETFSEKEAIDFFTNIRFFTSNF